jgi:uridine kinase
MYVKFIEPSKRHADVIVPHGGKNRIAIELIQAKLKELLARA